MHIKDITNDEELADPYPIVRNLKNHLKPNGIFIASIPNIRNWDILKSIIFEGDFRYQETGILDKTHLRFFCKKNAIELFTDSGYDVIRVNTKIATKPKSFRRSFKHLIYKILTLGNYDDFKAIQYFVVASKGK